MWSSGGGATKAPGTFCFLRSGNCLQPLRNSLPSSGPPFHLTLRNRLEYLLCFRRGPSHRAIVMRNAQEHRVPLRWSLRQQLAILRLQIDPGESLRSRWSAIRKRAKLQLGLHQIAISNRRGCQVASSRHLLRLARLRMPHDNNGLHLPSSRFLGQVDWICKH
jgi:hypothetical protein